MDCHKGARLRDNAFRSALRWGREAESADYTFQWERAADDQHESSPLPPVTDYGADDRSPLPPVRDSRRYACVECGKAFALKTNRDRHAKIHLKPKRITTCPEYGRTFAKPSLCRFHIMSVHKREELPHVCHICSAGFPTPSRLKRHMEGHE